MRRLTTGGRSFPPWRSDTFVIKGEEPHGRNGSAGNKGDANFFRKGLMMKRFLASVLIAVLGVVIIGCENKTGTTENKTETTTSQTKDGKTVDKTTTTVDTKTTTTPATPDKSGTTTEKTTETTTETPK